jgi:hypothetical protein
MDTQKRDKDRYFIDDNYTLIRKNELNILAWKGIVQNRNFINNPPESFADSKNVYVDNDNLLVSLQTNKTSDFITADGKEIVDIIDYGSVEIIVKSFIDTDLLRKYTIQFTEDGVILETFPFTGHKPLFYSVQDKIFIFLENIIYCYNNKAMEQVVLSNIKDYFYIPTDIDGEDFEDNLLVDGNTVKKTFDANTFIDPDVPDFALYIPSTKETYNITNFQPGDDLFWFYLASNTENIYRTKIVNGVLLIISSPGGPNNYYYSINNGLQKKINTLTSNLIIPTFGRNPEDTNIYWVDKTLGLCVLDIITNTVTSNTWGYDTFFGNLTMFEPANAIMYDIWDKECFLIADRTNILVYHSGCLSKPYIINDNNNEICPYAFCEIIINPQLFTRPYFTLNTMLTAATAVQVGWTFTPPIQGGAKYMTQTNAYVVTGVSGTDFISAPLSPGAILRSTSALSVPMQSINFFDSAGNVFNRLINTYVNNVDESNNLQCVSFTVIDSELTRTAKVYTATEMLHQTVGTANEKQFIFNVEQSFAISSNWKWPGLYSFYEVPVKQLKNIYAYSGSSNTYTYTYDYVIINTPRQSFSGKYNWLCTNKFHLNFLISYNPTAGIIGSSLSTFTYLETAFDELQSVSSDKIVYDTSKDAIFSSKNYLYLVIRDFDTAPTIDRNVSINMSIIPQFVSEGILMATNAAGKLVWNIKDIAQISYDNINNVIIPDLTMIKDNFFVNGSTSNIMSIENTDDNKPLLYLKNITKQVFEDNINFIQVVEAGIWVIFLGNAIYVAQEQVLEDGSTVYTYNKSRIPLGLRKGDETIILADGSSIVMPTEFGLTLMNYQEYLNTKEQKLTYITDNQITLYNKFYKEGPIKIVELYNHIVFYHEGLKDAMIFDTRNNSWWYVEFEEDITKMFYIQNQLYMSCPATPTRQAGLREIDPQGYGLDWFITSQIMHFNALNNYKHIEAITLTSVEETNFNCQLTCKAFRTVTHTDEPTTIKYDINDIRVFYKRLNIMQTTHFQYLLESIKNDVYRKPLRLTNFSIKYSIKDKVR